MAVAIQDKVLVSTLPGPDFGSNGNLSFLEILLESVREEISVKGDRDWLIDADPLTNDRKRRVRLTEIEPMSRLVGAALKNSGVVRGDVTSIILPNCSEYFFPVLGAWHLGAAVSLSDPGLTAEVLKGQLEETEARIIFCFQDTAKKLETLTEKEIVIIPNGEKGETAKNPKIISWHQFLLRGDQDVQTPVRRSIDDEAVIFWSSGTTGRPKGVVHTERFLKYTLQKSSFNPGTLVQTTCFYHTGGFFTPLSSGLYNKFVDSFLNPNRGISAEDILKICQEVKPVILVVGAHHALQMCSVEAHEDYDLGSVRAVAPMGSSVHATMPAELKKHFPNMFDGIYGFYGMTEVGTISLTTSPCNLGTLSPGCKAKIVDPVSGNLLGPNEVGEIIVYTPTTMKGYLNRPEENEKFFCKDGFVRTGDLGYYDDKGILYYHDRLKSLIKYNNIHIYPSSIEEVLYTHEAVAEAAVFGLPDPKCQELITAVVVKKEGFEVTEDELIDFVNGHVHEYKKLRGGLRFVESIPRNPQGKVLKPELRKLFSA